MTVASFVLSSFSFPNVCDPSNRAPVCGTAVIVITGAGELLEGRHKDGLALKSKSDLGLLAGAGIVRTKEFVFSSADDTVPSNLGSNVETYRSSPESWDRFLGTKGKDSAGKSVGLQNYLNELKNSPECERLVGPHVKVMSNDDFSKHVEIITSINTHTITDEKDPKYFSIPLWADDKLSGTDKDWNNMNSQGYLERSDFAKLRALAPKARFTSFADACDGVNLLNALMPPKDFPEQCTCFVSLSDENVATGFSGEDSAWAKHKTPPRDASGNYSAPWSGVDNAFQLIPTAYSATDTSDAAHRTIELDDEEMVVGMDNIYGYYVDGYGKTPANPLAGFSKSSAHHVATKILKKFINGTFGKADLGGGQLAKLKALDTAQFADQIPALDIGKAKRQPVSFAPAGGEWLESLTKAETYDFNKIENDFTQKPHDYTPVANYMSEVFSFCFGAKEVSPGDSEKHKDIFACREMARFIKSSQLSQDKDVKPFVDFVSRPGVGKLSALEKLAKEIKNSNSASAQKMASFHQLYKDFRRTVATKYLAQFRDEAISETTYENGVATFQRFTRFFGDISHNYFRRNLDYFQKNAYGVGLAQIKNAGLLLSNYVASSNDPEAKEMLEELKSQIDCLSQYPIGRPPKNKVPVPRKDVADGGKHQSARLQLDENDSSVPAGLDENGQKQPRSNRRPPVVADDSIR